MEEEYDSPSLRGLSDAQRVAISLIVTGATDSTVAGIVGRTLETVNRWRHRHPEFKAELNRQRQRLEDEQADECREMNRLALDHLHQKMRDGDDEAFKIWFRISGVGKINTSVTGRLDSDDIITDQVLHRMQRREEELEDPESRSFNIRSRFGGPGPVDIRQQVERELRAVNNCAPDPEDLEPEEIIYPTDALAGESDIA